MFLLLIVAVLAIASTVAVVADVKTDGYSYYANQQTLRFS